MPRAVSKLQRLQFLSLLANPIKIVDSHVFQQVGRTLLHLAITLYGVRTWPTAFQYLSAVQVFNITGFRNEIPPDGFEGLHNTLQALNFAYDHLRYMPTLYVDMDSFMYDFIPPAVCKLGQLQDLTIAIAVSVPQRRLVNCNSSMPSITSLSFPVYGDDHFPDVFDTFPNLQSLRIQNSFISSIHIKWNPNTTCLSSLQLTDSLLVIIPSAVNEFPLLQTLDLSYNMIRSIGRHGLHHLFHLTHLFLHYNPIMVMSNDAFLDLPTLQFVSLAGNTHLYSIPIALQLLPNLRDLDLDSTMMFCDCNSTVLKTWSLSGSVIISGQCLSGVRNQLIRFNSFIANFTLDCAK